MENIGTKGGGTIVASVQFIYQRIPAMVPLIRVSSVAGVWRMNVVLGILIVVITIYFLFREYEPRLLLIASGLLMAGIALDPLTVLDEFAYKMATDSLIQAICSSLGFGFVLRATGCEKHLFAAFSWIRGYGLFIIPLVTLTTFGVNAILMSAGNTAAAIGCFLIPLMIRAGIHPAVAGAAILTGTFGSMLNPLLPVNIFVAEIAGVAADTVVQAQSLFVLFGLIAGAGWLVIYARWKNEHAIDQDTEDKENQSTETINWGYVITPFIPLVILVLGSSGLVPDLRIGVAQAMCVGTLFALLITRTSPSKVTEEFFQGMGYAYANAIGLIIAVAVFVRGMKSLELMSFFISWMTTTPGIAKVGAVVGPFMMGVMTGSGDAAAFAFSEVVAPHAFLYGMETMNMGSMASIAGAIGRTVSPFAGATIVCACIAGVNPVALVKRNFPGIVLPLFFIGFFL